MGINEIPKSPEVWNLYFERMFPSKKEGSKIYTGMLIGHDEDTYAMGYRMGLLPGRESG